MTFRGSMAKSDWNLLLAVAIFILMLAQVFLPFLDDSSPPGLRLRTAVSLSIAFGYKNIILGGLSMFMGLLMTLCAHHLLDRLLKEHQDYRILRVYPRTIFLLLAGVYMAGVGFRASAFTIQTRLTKEEEETVHHYQLWGHNVYEFGYFTILLLLAWTEYSNFHTVKPSPVVRDEPAEGAPVVRDEPAERAPVVRDEPAEGAPPVRDERLLIIYVLKVMILSMIMGAGYSSLACILLGTVLLTAGFYIAAIFMGCIIYYNIDQFSRVRFESCSVATLVVLSSIGGLIILLDLCLFDMIL